MKTNLKYSIIAAAILASTSAIAFDPNLTPHGIGSADSTLMGGITAGVLVPIPPPPPTLIYVPHEGLVSMEYFLELVDQGFIHGWTYEFILSINRDIDVRAIMNNR